MIYALKILWRERTRYLAAVLAVLFSALLIAVQCGLLLGLLMYASLPIDRTSADLWVTTADAPSLGLGRPIPEEWLNRVIGQPGVERAEVFLEGGGTWHKPDQGSAEPCMILGARIEPDSLGAMTGLTPELRLLLSEPDAVVIDESEVPKLGLKTGKDEYAEISDHRVRVVGTLRGFRGVTNPFVFCSVQTCRRLVPQFDRRRDLATYILARCHDPADAPRVAGRLNALYPDMRAYASADFSERTRSYWLFRSQAGLVMQCTVTLALLVGLVVTSQTLRGAVLAALRELATLDALGIPRWRLLQLVLAQSFWIGLIGLALAFPFLFLVSGAAQLVQTKVLLPGWLLLLTAGLTLGMALLAGVSVLRTLHRIEPASLLR
jgi:putative ABC transport system permease protein